MSYKHKYTIKPLTGTENPSWKCIKIDKDGLPDGEYIVTKPGNHYNCECFAVHRHTCRHRDMVRMYENDQEFRTKIDGGWLYDFDKDKWQAPVSVGEM